MLAIKCPPSSVGNLSSPPTVLCEYWFRSAVPSSNFASADVIRPLVSVAYVYPSSVEYSTLGFKTFRPSTFVYCSPYSTVVALPGPSESALLLGSVEFSVFCCEVWLLFPDCVI